MHVDTWTIHHKHLHNLDLVQRRVLQSSVCWAHSWWALAGYDSTYTKRGILRWRSTRATRSRTTYVNMANHNGLIFSCAWTRVKFQTNTVLETWALNKVLTSSDSTQTHAEVFIFWSHMCLSQHRNYGLYCQSGKEQLVRMNSALLFPGRRFVVNPSTAIGSMHIQEIRPWYLDDF